MLTVQRWIFSWAADLAVEGEKGRFTRQFTNELPGRLSSIDSIGSSDEDKDWLITEYGV